MLELQKKQQAQGCVSLRKDSGNFQAIISQNLGMKVNRRALVCLNLLAEYKAEHIISHTTGFAPALPVGNGLAVHRESLVPYDQDQGQT